MSAIYFPGCEVFEEDEKLRLLTKDKNIITAKTAINRIMSRYYYNLVPEDVAERYVNIILQVAEDNIDNDNYSILDVLNSYYAESFRISKEIELKYNTPDGECPNSIRVIKNAMMDYISTMSVDGYTPTRVFGYDLIKSKYDSIMQTSKDEPMYVPIMEYLRDSGYVDEYEDFCEKHNINKEKENLKNEDENEKE